MRLRLDYFLRILLVLFSTAQAEDMPEVVNRFQESKDLWTELFHGGGLPGSYFKPLDAAPTDTWQNFLKEHGDGLIQQA